jgi:hypothetical protein
MADAWYYAEDGESVGPVSIKTLREVVLTSHLDGETRLVWRKGFTDWKSPIEVDELSDLFDRPPPLPRRSSPGSKVVEDFVETSTPKTKREKKWWEYPLSLLGGLVGLVLARVFGGSFYLPAALIGVTWFILVKCKTKPVAVPMLAIVIGHTGWVVVGNVAAYSMGNEPPDGMWFLLEVAIVAALSVWFLSAQSRAAAIGILIYQIVSLAGGVSTMDEMSMPGVSSQAVAIAQTMHIILRIVGAAFCVYAIVKLRKNGLANPSTLQSQM